MHLKYFWSCIKICLEIHQRVISWSIWNPSEPFCFCISTCVIYIKRISAELRIAQKDIQEKIITLWTSSAGLSFFLICIFGCALDVHYRKVPLSQIVWGCFCPLESGFRSETNSHFKWRDCCMSRSIHRVGPRQTTIILWTRMLTLLKFTLNCHLSCQMYNNYYSQTGKASLTPI